MACFADINVSQGSVATYARCGGIFWYPLTANLPRNLQVKKFLKSVRIWQNYGQSLWPHFFLTHPVCPTEQCNRRTHSDAERTCSEVNSHRHTRQDCRAYQSTTATQARQAAMPSCPTAHTQRCCTPQKCKTRCGLLHNFFMTRPKLLH